MNVHKGRTDEYWCPFARPWGDGTNRNPPSSAPSVGTGCIGDRCMAWRWKDSRMELGYCGLAGRPIGALK